MSPIRRRGVGLVLSAPSGAGKTSIAHALIKEEPALTLSVSVTTRPPRAGEQDGVNYHFRSQAAFDALVASNGLLEHASVFGRSYGTPREPVERALDAGRDVLFDIDWQGHRSLGAALPGDVVGVFVLPPSLAALESRLRGRAADEGAEIARRMAAAREEIGHWSEFDHVMVNEDFARAVASVRAVLHAARLATSRQRGLDGFVAALRG